MPLQIGAASTKLYIERGADWCGQGKNNSFFEGCGMSTCPYGITKNTFSVIPHRYIQKIIRGNDIRLYFMYGIGGEFTLALKATPQH